MMKLVNKFPPSFNLTKEKRDMSKGNYCLVLSGGGAKGVYHIGVWQALQELEVEVDAFIGNSIGAIIAGFLAQGKIKRLEEIGSSMSIDFILNIPEEFIENGEIKITTPKLSSFIEFYQNIINKKGLDTAPLQRLLNNDLDESKIRKIGNDLGIVTYRTSDLKPREVFIEDMEEGELINYLLASSALPGFEQPEIAGKKYIDGGVYDNIPYNMARQRGYRKIIVSDISGMGVRRKMDISGSQTIYIKNSINMGGVLDFDRKFLDDYTTLGYLDTLKTFEKLSGYHYFIIPDEKFENDFKEIIYLNKQNVLDYEKSISGKEKSSFTLALKNIFPKHSQFKINWLSVFTDCAATILSIQRIKRWTYTELQNEVKKQVKSINKMVEKLNKGKLFNIEAFLKNLKEEKELVESPYYYYLLIDNYIKGNARKLALRPLFRLYPELPAGLFFVNMAQEKKLK